MNRSDPSFVISQVEPANITMNGSRTTQAASLPVASATARAIHHEIGGWSK